MATGSLKLLFDEHFSHLHVTFVNQQSRLAHMQHMRPIGWSGQPDTQWIPLAVRQGFVIVMGARNERTRGFTTTDLKAMDARVVLVGPFWDHMNRWERAKWLVASIERITEIASALPPGSVELIDGRGGTKSL